MPPRPLISFCIATHNRGPILIHCLKKILHNGLPTSQFEIRLIDNASTDNTISLLQQHFTPDQLHLTRLPKNVGPVAKNIAMRQAQGQFLLLIDDDAYPHPGATAQMLRHFHDNPNLAAAVFDVTLPDGSKEASAYPDIFIGAGTALRRSALEKIAHTQPQLKLSSQKKPRDCNPCGTPLPPIATLPSHFFMQAEEYDLSFRLLDAEGGGFSIQRFWDLPLTHLKTPNARIGQRTTRLDVRNNLFLLAKYLPDPLSHQLAADWLARYWIMAEQRDESQSPHPTLGSHKTAFLQGAAQGLSEWSTHRDVGQHLLAPSTIERIFKFTAIKERLRRATDRLQTKQILFADFGKNMLAYYQAAKDLNLEIIAIADDNLGRQGRDYRGIPLQTWSDLQPILTKLQKKPEKNTPIIVSNLSPVHVTQRIAALRRTHFFPVIGLFTRSDPLIHGPPIPLPALA